MSLNQDWLDDGGWYLLLPRPLLSCWRGVSTDDYDRFCAATDNWLTQLPVADGFGFALGGDPGMALVAPQPDGAVALIRWHYGDSEDELIAFALRGEFGKRTEADIVIENHERNWVLFNATADPSVDNPSTRTVPFPIGDVRIQTAFLEHCTNAAVVHTIRGDGPPTQHCRRGPSGTPSP